MYTPCHISFPSRMNASGVYVFWFVADNAYTARHGQRMWWMAREMMRTGVLQRWAYVSCFAACPPVVFTEGVIKTFVPSSTATIRNDPALVSRPA